MSVRTIQNKLINLGVVRYSTISRFYSGETILRQFKKVFWIFLSIQYYFKSETKEIKRGKPPDWKLKKHRTKFLPYPCIFTVIVDGKIISTEFLLNL